MKYTKEDITNSFSRIALSLKTDDDVLKEEDMWLIENIPIIDELIRTYNKVEYNKKLNDRFIRCKLCNVEVQSKNKTNHIRTTKHQAKLNGDIDVFEETIKNKE
jgi:uncharacterized protein with PIN domain